MLSPKTEVLHSNFKAYAVDGDGKETSVHIGRYVMKNITYITYVVFKRTTLKLSIIKITN